MIRRRRSLADYRLRAVASAAIATSLMPLHALASENGAMPWSAIDPMDIPGFIAIQRPAPTAEIRYGSDAAQTVDLFVPEGRGPFPVVVLIHGGCWSAKTAGREQLRHVAADLARRGMAVWSVGYRRADEPGGGYPGTYRDVATAIDLLREQAPRHRLDSSRAVLVGHSAGGHLALWAAGRDRLGFDSRLHTFDPFVPRSVVVIAGIGDLEKFVPQIPSICGPGIAENLVAGVDRDGENAYVDTSPAVLGANAARVMLISGVLDKLVPPYVAHDYARSVRSDLTVELVNVEGAGHFDLVVPGRPGWDVVSASIESALERRKIARAGVPEASKAP